MYPEDEQPATNRNTIGDAPAPFVYGQPPVGQKRKKKPRPALWWLPWAICAVLFVLVLIFGILWVSKSGSDNGKKDAALTDSSDTKDDSKDDDTATEECTAKQRRYQNEDLEIAFCYPVSWGDVKVADCASCHASPGQGDRLKLGGAAVFNQVLAADLGFKVKGDLG